MQQKVRRIAALWTAVLLFEAPLALAQVNSGSIVGWGARVVGNGSSLSGTIAVAAGRFRSVALQADGSVLTWGSNADGQCLVPLPNVDFTAVAGGGEHNLGLRSDGTIVTWGNNEYGQCDVPAPESGFVGVAAGNFHSLGLRSDGSIAAWGWNNYGQSSAPTPNADFVAADGGAITTWP
ncbi:MAG: hypothetical protein IPJ24_01740 [bacterium]|nr:hypothetical protein [bacterium]